MSDAFAINEIARIIAERDALRARVAELEAELKEAMATIERWQDAAQYGRG